MRSLCRVENIEHCSYGVLHYNPYLAEDVLFEVDVQSRHRLVEVKLILGERDFVAKFVLSVVFRLLLDGVIAQVNVLVQAAQIVLPA